MKKWIYLILVVVVILVGIFMGAKFTGIGGGILALLFGNEIRKKKKETEKAKEEAEQAEQNYEETKKQNDEKIQEAGENINAETYDNADDARSGINNFLDSDGE